MTLPADQLRTSRTRTVGIIVLISECLKLVSVQYVTAKIVNIPGIGHDPQAHHLDAVIKIKEREDGFQKLFHLPQQVIPMAYVVIGRPDQDLKSPIRFKPE
jgi:hypothetical protein